MLSNLFAILFYSTLVLFVFIRIFNGILVKKYNCKDYIRNKQKK